MITDFSHLPIRALVTAISLPLMTPAHAAPPVIDDQKILNTLTSEMEKTVGNDGIPSADELATKAKDSKLKTAGIPLPSAPETPPANTYETLSQSVYIVGSLYKCGKCSKWHQGGAATAWCLDKSGLMVTNAHVFTGAKGGCMSVADRDGNIHPIIELLGINPSTDVAIFRVKTKEDLQALPLGATADVGSPVTVISNPSGNFFLNTTGTVSRYSKSKTNKANKKKVTWMSVTADYAKGSSGGPVFNDAGEVIGMVASTRSIYTKSGPGQSKDKPEGSLQMVIKNCVPIESIRALFEAQNSPEKQHPTKDS